MKTLVLARTYEPIAVIDWRRAYVMCNFPTTHTTPNARVELEYDKTFKSSRGEHNIPAVIVLLHNINFRPKPPKITSTGIFIRDGHRCMYCGDKYSRKDLSVDHMKPKSRGGRNTWRNLITACKPCNNKKADRTPEEAEMLPINNAFIPTWPNHSTIPEEWIPYMY